MTCCLSRESENDRKQFEEYRDVTRRRGWVLAAVNVECQGEENERRLVSEGRVGDIKKGKTKLLDKEVLNGLRRGFT
jgi:hypothetical protein